MILEGKRLLITGVITKDSIAFHAAEQAQKEGAEVVLTSFGRVRRMTERAAQRLPEPADVLELDVNKPDDLEALTGSLRERWGRLDGALHAIAFAPGDAIGGEFMKTPRESAKIAFETSAYSYKALAECVAPLMEEGGALVGLDFDATVAWPSYDWMGVAKAALESVNRYLAKDLGPQGIRANLISAGPVHTAAASGISGFSDLESLWGDAAPLGLGADHDRRDGHPSPAAPTRRDPDARPIDDRGDARDGGRVRLFPLSVPRRTRKIRQPVHPAAHVRHTALAGARGRLRRGRRRRHRFEGARDAGRAVGGERGTATTRRGHRRHRDRLLHAHLRRAGVRARTRAGSIA